MTAPDELETTLLEWAKGPYQLSAAECRVVMARLAELEADNADMTAYIRSFAEKRARIHQAAIALEVDVARLTAERDALKTDDPNRNSVFEYMRDADGTVTQIRTVTTTAWRPL